MLGERDPGDGGWGARIVVLVAAALAVAFVLGGVPGLLVAGGDEPARLNTSEYDPADLSTQRIPANGEVSVAGGDGDGTVVIDRSHANRFSRTQIDALYAALSRAGYEVVLYDRGDLESALATASAFVVIDPGIEYDDADTAALRSFTADGGRLLVLGEPNRVVVSGGLGGVTTSQRHSHLANLAAEFDLDFSTGYVYHQSAHDGYYKNPLAESVGDASGSGTDVALYTAATVRSTGGGDPVLRMRPDGRLSGSDGVDQYPVAVRDDNVLAVGDASFVAPGRYNVGDNERFLSYVVAFLAGGEQPDPDGFDGDDGGDGDGARTPDGPSPTDPDGTPTGTPTPDGTPTETPAGTPPGTPDEPETPGTPGTPRTPGAPGS